MSDLDAKTLSRSAQPMMVFYQTAAGTPPSWPGRWRQLSDTTVGRIEINAGPAPSVAVIELTGSRFDAALAIKCGDMIKITSAERYEAERSVMFAGFITGFETSLTAKHEQLVMICNDHLWLASQIAPLFGQFARGPDDYTDYGGESQEAIDDSAVFLSARRCVFNESSRANRDPVELEVTNADAISQGDEAETICESPIFCNTGDGEFWTARQMIQYCLGPLQNIAADYLNITDPADITGLDHADFGQQLRSVSVEGLNVIDAVDVICKAAGFGFRLSYNDNGSADLIFYKTGAADSYARSSSEATIRHRLYVPAVAENISTAVAAASKMATAVNFVEDIAAVINNPWGLGSPEKYEITAELVPAWKDSDFTIDGSWPFLTEADIASLAGAMDPDDFFYYKYYHTSGSAFRRNVGRRWCLNESGRYTLGSYDRGTPFDLAAAGVEADRIYGADGKRQYAPYDRVFLDALTSKPDSISSLGIIVEFSFDSGSSWQQVPCAIVNLTTEAGIYISEPNLAEILDRSGGTISGGDLDGKEVNFFTSLADDKLTSRSFKSGSWHTRLRVTASIQTDQRLRRQVLPSPASGSPFNHSKIFDYSGKYRYYKRASSSRFATSDLDAYEVDSASAFDSFLDKIRRANEDMSISGQFTLDRMWTGDGAGEPSFAIGDLIEGLDGRGYELAASFNDTAVFPEIIQIVYLPQKQIQRLITRDLRKAIRYFQESSK